MTAERAVDFASAKLAAPVRVKDAAGNVTVTTGGGHLDRGDHEAGFHAFVDRPAEGLSG